MIMIKGFEGEEDKEEILQRLGLWASRDEAHEGVSKGLGAWCVSVSGSCVLGPKHIGESVKMRR